MSHITPGRPVPGGLEAFAPGQIITHSLRRTLTQQDNTWFTLLTLNTAHHFDVTSPSFAQFGGVLMNSCVTLGVIQGLALSDFGNVCLPSQGFGEIRMTSPVFAGDTVRAESTILERKSEPDGTGTLVHVLMRGYTQNDAKFIEFDRTYISAPTGAWKKEIARRTAGAPKLDPQRRFVPQINGPYLEDFAVGDIYDHGFGRTMTRDESIWFSLLHHNANRHYVDESFATAEGAPGVLIDDTFVLSTVTGIGVRHTTQIALANLGWKNVQFHTPVFSGDTLFSETEVLNVRASNSRPGQGIVSVRTTGRNQRGEVVVSFDRAFLTRSRQGGQQ